MWRVVVKLLFLLSFVCFVGCTSHDVDGCELDEDCGVGERCEVESGVCVAQSWGLEEEAKSSGPDPVRDMSAPDPVTGRDDQGGGGPVEPGVIVCEEGEVCEEVCLEFDEGLLDFGRVPVGELRTQRLQIRVCEALARPVFVQDFRLRAGGEVFKLNAWSIGGLPFVIEPGNEVFIEVLYEARAGAVRGELALDVSAQGDGAPARRYEIDVRGEGLVEPAGNMCPVASGTGTPESGETGPRKSFDALSPGDLWLDGSLSYDRDEGDSISAYRWSVASEPFGAGLTIEGADRAVARVSLEEEGFYILRLRVYDRWGKESCRASDVRVNVKR